MAWVYLLFAGLFEVAWAFSMKLSEGFSRPVPTLITIVTMIASFWLLSIAMRALPLGTAYAVWTGIGAIGAFIVGISFLGEPLSLVRGIAVVMIAGGIVLMGATSAIGH
jgi:quaternary ammonium compound-resistance protein SugE